MGDAGPGADFPGRMFHLSFPLDFSVCPVQLCRHSGTHPLYGHAQPEYHDGRHQILGQCGHHLPVRVLETDFHHPHRPHHGRSAQSETARLILFPRCLFHAHRHLLFHFRHDFHLHFCHRQRRPQRHSAGLRPDRRARWMAHRPKGSHGGSHHHVGLGRLRKLHAVLCHRHDLHFRGRLRILAD